jgi:hypothetical protein
VEEPEKRREEMVIVRVSKPEYVVIEPGEYLCTLEKITEHTGRYGPLLRFHFRIDAGEPFEGLPVTLACSSFLTPGNKLDKLLQELGCNALGIGDEVDLDDLAGQSVKAKCYVENFKDGENIYNNVTKVRKTRAGETSSKPAEKKEATPAAAKPEEKKEAAPAATPEANKKVDLKTEDIPF